jgi:hypothetical protein
MCPKDCSLCTKMKKTGRQPRGNHVCIPMMGSLPEKEGLPVD